MLGKIIGIVALALAAGLIAAGCGGDDETTTSSTATTTAAGATGATGATGELTKDEFIKQADAICASGDKTIEEAFKALGSGQPSDQEAEQVITDTAVPETQTEIDGIRALTPPAGDEDEVTAILDAAQSALDEVKADPSLLTQQGTDPFKEANQLANDYGLNVCGQS